MTIMSANYYQCSTNTVPSSEGPLQLHYHSIQYRSIGGALLALESQGLRFRKNLPSAYKAFQEDMAFVSSEVLESYLDDLLDLEISNQHLFIERESSKIQEFLIPCCGLLASIACGLYVASYGASMIWSFALSSILASPFAILLSRTPQSGAARRMFFAQIVSHEILRRRGDDGEHSHLKLISRGFQWDRMLLHGGSSSCSMLH